MYDYEKQKDFVFTDEGQRRFLNIRDRAFHLIKAAGAARAQEIMSGFGGDSWQLMACLDRLVEIGDLIRVDALTGYWQYRIYGRKDQ